MPTKPAAPVTNTVKPARNLGRADLRTFFLPLRASREGVGDFAAVGGRRRRGKEGKEEEYNEKEERRESEFGE